MAYSKIKCITQDLVQNNDGTIKCDSGWLIEPETATTDFLTTLITTFDPTIASLLMLSLFTGLSTGFGGGMILNVIRKGRNL